MSYRETLYTLYADDRKFMIKGESLDQFPESLLTKLIIEGESNKYCFSDSNNNIYIDRDPISVAYIVNTYRQYDFDVDNIQDDELRNKVKTDLKLFGLYKDLVDVSLKQTGGDINSKDSDIIQELLQSNEETSHDSNKTHDMFSKFLLSQLSKKNNDITETSQIFSEYSGGGNINTDALQSNDEGTINSFIKSLDSKLNSGNSFNVIQELSTDPNMLSLIMKSQKNQTDSSESLSDLPELEGFSGGGIESDSENSLPNSLQNSESQVELNLNPGPKNIRKRFVRIN